MAKRRWLLVVMNAAVLLGLVLGSLSRNVDKFGLYAIAALFFLVFNGMYFAARTESDLSPERRKQLNRWVVWPIIALAAFVIVFEFFER
jgi:hypothetical protein